MMEGPTGNHVLHVRDDSDLDLDALFAVAMSPSNGNNPQSKPMRLRNLPASFFNPSEKRSHSPAMHSRQSSIKTDGPASPGLVQSPGGSESLYPKAKHSNSQSAPASFQQMMEFAQIVQHQHLRQQSFDVLGGEDTMESDEVPLPPGWDMAKTSTGQCYFLHHATQTTTWEDPRKKLPQAATMANSCEQLAESLPMSDNGGGDYREGAVKQQPGGSGPQNQVTPGTLGPLPDGWEETTTPDGEVYFINHQTRTTSWFHPSTQMHQQQTPATPQTQQGAAANSTSGSGSLSLLQQALDRPPLSNVNQLIMQQIQERVAAISTSGGANQSLLQQDLASQPIDNPTPNRPTMQQRQQLLRLQRLQVEGKRLKLRQQEVMINKRQARQQEIMINERHARQKEIMINERHARQKEIMINERHARQKEIMINEEQSMKNSSDVLSSLILFSNTGLNSFKEQNNVDAGSSSVGICDFRTKNKSHDSGLDTVSSGSMSPSPEEVQYNTGDYIMETANEWSTAGQEVVNDLSCMDLGQSNNIVTDEMEASMQEDYSSELFNVVDAMLSNNNEGNGQTWV